MAEPQGTRGGYPRSVDRPAGGARPSVAARELERLFELVRDQLAAEGELPKPLGSDPEALRRELGLALGDAGSTADAVAAKLRRLLAATPSSASPRFLNQLFGGRDPMALVAEMLTPLVNTSMYTYKVAGPQVLVEREVLGHMAARLGYRDGDGMLAPGGSLANLAAMLLARNDAVADVRDHGLDGRRLTVYTSADGHYSMRKNAGILGLGRDAVRAISTGPDGRMDLAELERAIAADRAAGARPLLVNATAGTTVLGAFDPIREIAAVAARAGAWLHVDGALGASVVLSSRHHHLLDGVELADSVTWNAHKLMGVPLPCSALLVRRRGLLGRHLGEHADYLFQSAGDELNPGTRSLQCGRRNDALKLWAAWQLHGDRGYDRRITRLFDLAAYAATAIAAAPDLELVLEPPSVNVCFTVVGRSSAAICERLERDGRLLIGHGRALGRRAIRLACVNPDLDAADLDAALEEVRAAAAALPAGDDR